MQCSCGFFQIIVTEFAACSKPPSRDDRHREASFPMTQQRRLHPLVHAVDYVYLWLLHCHG